MGGLATPQRARAAVGFCSLASHGYYQVLVHKDISQITGNYFDLVKGDAYARDLDVCIGASQTQGGTFVLPANVQEEPGMGPGIFQAGYGKRTTDGSILFFYANGDATAIAISGATPSIGHRYRFRIQKDSNAHPDFYIDDVTTGSGAWSNTTTNTSYSIVYDYAWWGFETWDSYSHHGPNLPDPGVGMAYMGYSSDLSTTTFYRSGMTVSGDVCKCGGDWSQVDGNHQTVLTIGNWVYGGDKFDAEVHP